MVFRTSHQRVLDEWNMYLRETQYYLDKACPIIQIDLRIGDSIPDDWRELQVSPTPRDVGTTRQWRQHGLSLTEFCWGAGWIGRDKVGRRVWGSLKRGALENPGLVKGFALWGVVNALDVLAANLPSHLVMLHASAVARDGYAMIALGNSGSGKTTICTSLLERGFALLSDDLTIVDLSRQPPYVIPLLTFAHINRDTLRFLPRLAVRIEETEDEQGDYTISFGKIAAIYCEPPRSPVPLSIVALGETRIGDQSLVESVTAEQIILRGYEEQTDRAFLNMRHL